MGLRALGVCYNGPTVRVSPKPASPVGPGDTGDKSQLGNTPPVVGRQPPGVNRFIGVTHRPLSGPGAALEALRLGIQSDRVGAWQQVTQVFPGMGAPVREHLKELGTVRALLALSPQRTRRNPPPNPLKGVRLCTLCHWALPHQAKEARSRHYWYMRVAKTRKHRWAKYPEARDRRAQNSLARLTILTARQDRWVAALRVADPLRVEHLLRSQGREAVLKFWRTLSKHRRTALLRAVPPPPKRRFKGESLVLAGLRPARTPKGAP